MPNQNNALSFGIPFRPVPKRDSFIYAGSGLFQPFLCFSAF